jgi:hypothetical protein
MPRMSWTAPEGRFFDTGIDRGVLYPKKTPPQGSVVFQNKVPNPDIAVDNSTYTNTGATNARDTTWRSDGALKVTATGADSKVFVAGGTGAMRLGMQAGKKYTVSADINTPVALSGTLSANARRIVVAHRIGAGTWNFATSAQGPVTGEARLSVTVTLPVGTTEAYVNLYNGSATAGQYVLWDKIMLVEGESSEYFDGDSPTDNLYTYEWTGAANATPSNKRERVSLAVPWIGLTGVDEQGGDGAAAYYIDGRPFLFLPKPKEYQATLRAYTYPDEFSEIMGVTEVADGMYLDSQPGAAFDLSYRTLVGSALKGIDHGYKIHLVYNAVVTPQSLSYDTLGASVNPVEFSWDIQAVPVRVEGFRPTAHIIIDTRHMAQDTIDAIEDMLYGSETTLAGMPSPQDVFDLLNYGDTIIVTDMGDGTFTVEGAYENVYMVGPGEFRVDNVDGETYADGTFVISSTNV